MFPFGVSVQVLSTVRDRHGDSVEAVAGTIDGCGFAPESSIEDTDQRAQTVNTASLYVPPTAVAVTGQSVLRIDGKRWRVDGDPEWWRHPWTGWTPGGVLRIRRVLEGDRPAVAD